MIILHIGCHKTGTTSIQRFLAANAMGLPALGFQLIQHANTGAYHPLARVLMERGGSWDEFRRSRPCTQLLRRLDKSAKLNCIVSSEDLESLLDDKVALLQRLLGDRDVRVVVYLRRQEEIIQAAYLQQTKTGFNLRPFREWFQHHFGRHQPGANGLRFDYYQLLKRWADVFGKERICRRIYDRSSLLRGDAVDDFLSIIGFPEQAGATLPRPPDDNVSPGPITVELLRRFALLNPGLEAAALREKLGLLERLAPRQWPDENRRLLIGPQLRKCEELYYFSNRVVAKEFFGRDDGQLFGSAAPEPADKQLPSLDHALQLMWRVLNDSPSPSA